MYIPGRTTGNTCARRESTLQTGLGWSPTPPPEMKCQAALWYYRSSVWRLIFFHQTHSSSPDHRCTCKHWLYEPTTIPNHVLACHVMFKSWQTYAKTNLGQVSGLIWCVEKRMWKSEEDVEHLSSSFGALKCIKLLWARTGICWQIQQIRRLRHL